MPILGARRLNHLQDNAAAATVELSDAELAKLGEACKTSSGATRTAAEPLTLICRGMPAICADADGSHKVAIKLAAASKRCVCMVTLRRGLEVHKHSASRWSKAI